MKVFKTLFSPEDSTTTTSNLQVTVSQIIPVFTVLILHRHCYRPGQLQANQVYQLTTSIQVGVYTARGNPILGGNSTRTEIFFRQTEQPSHSGHQHGTRALFTPFNHARIPETSRNANKTASADDAINMVIGTGTTCMIRRMWLVN